MIRLLNAGFTRLKKNKLFWLLIIFSILLAIFMIFTQYNDMKKYNDIIKLEQLIVNYSTIVGIVIAIFTSLFLGVEYSDGVIKNKISIGHTRVNIYLSNLIITTIASILSYVLFIIVIVIIGIPLFGGITISITRLLVLIGCVFVTILAYSSIFTFIAMIISSKALSSIVSILLAFSLTVIALICLSILSETEYINTGQITNSETMEFKYVEIPNPHYPSETKKKVCQMLLDMNPAGQMFQIAGLSEVNLKVLPLYSFGILIIFSGIGLILFKQKELK